LVKILNYLEIIDKKIDDVIENLRDQEERLFEISDAME